MTEQEKKEIVDVFIVCLVAMACPLLIPVAIMKVNESERKLTGGDKE